MLEIIGWWEYALALGVCVLALGEVFALVAARRAGLTRNVSRLVTHGVMSILSILYAAVAVSWSGSLGGSPEGLVGTRVGIANWGFLLLAGILILVLYELVAHIWAMNMGLTKSVPRLVTHIAMATILALLFMMNLTRWQVYTASVVQESGLATGATRGMLATFGRWELVLVAGVVLLAAGELLGLSAARRAGKTQNVSRLVVYGLLVVLAVVYGWIEVSWARGLTAGGITVGSGHPAIAEWGLAVVALMLVLAVYSVVVVAWARQFGLTTTVSRLVSNVVMVAFVVLIVAINLSRWQMYFGLLEQSYEESIQTPGALE